VIITCRGRMTTENVGFIFRETDKCDLGFYNIAILSCSNETSVHENVSREDWLADLEEQIISRTYST
jgi:hypothetical protein